MKKMKKILKAVDIEVGRVDSNQVAYFRLSKEMKEFFDKCLEKKDVIGFEYEFGSYNFGVILDDKN